MKQLITLITSMLLVFGVNAQDSDSTGRQGDNLDLYAVLDLFKDSKNLEDFEKELNSEKSEVNNLDLNNDGNVDYIMVIDQQDSLSHAIILRVPISATESQDVAVIEVEEVGDEVTNIQIIGDEELYGENYIVEPAGASENDVVNVYSWRPIRHIYGPRYVIWVSPWRFGYYPRWYKPWPRVYWHTYHRRHVHHHARYRVVRTRRLHRAHHHYQKHKTHSVWFHNNHMKQSPVIKKTTAKEKVSKPLKTKGKVTTSPVKKSSDRKRPGGTLNTNQETKKSSGTRKRPGGTLNTNKDTKKSSGDRKRPGGTIKNNTKRKGR